MIRTLAVFLSVLLVSQVGALATPTNEEVLWGLYSFQSKKLAISFRWDEAGITQMRINGKEYASRQIFADAHSTYESWVIRVQESGTRQKSLHLAFLVNHHKPIFVSGFYADIQRATATSTDFDVKAVQSIEMRYAPLEGK